ncbi:MAG: hypothetical protein ABIR83_10655 [Nakamurella sp.]
MTAVVVLVAAAAVVGARLNAAGHDILLPFPPLIAVFRPHLGPITPVVVGIAVTGVLLGPAAAVRARWRRLLFTGYAVSLAWTVGLALVDGWHQGFVDRLTGSDEYLHDLPRMGPICDFLAGFTGRILDFQPDSWTTHVSSHPPLATLVFWALDRVGLGGGTWASAVVVLIGSSAGVAVLVTLRELGAEAAARRAAPFLVLFPGAVWVGVSADGMFAGVVSWGIALAVRGVRRGGRGGAGLATLGGVLLGATLYLSYGLSLMVFPVAAVCWLAVRDRSDRAVTVRRWLWVVAGVAVVAGLFVASGFDWFEGVRVLDVRYYQGIATTRPYSYFVWANLAAFCLSAGPAAAAGLARAVGRVWPARVLRPRIVARRPVVAVISLAAALSVVVADLTGLSKAETERIWLSFAIWVLVSTALIPRRSVRWLLAVQVLVALGINHLTLTYW